MNSPSSPPASNRPTTCSDRGESFLARVKQPIHVGSMHVHIGGTLGIARYPGDATTAPELLKKADLGALCRQADASRVGQLLLAGSRRTVRAPRRGDGHAARRAGAAVASFPSISPRCASTTAAAAVSRRSPASSTEDGAVIGPVDLRPGVGGPRAGATRRQAMLTRGHRRYGALAGKRGSIPSRSASTSAEADFADGKLVNRVLQRPRRAQAAALASDDRGDGIGLPRR